MIKPHCGDFTLDPLNKKVCWWWAIDETDDGYCSRPGWEPRTCETHGQRNIPEDALSGPVGINVARLFGIELPEIGEHPNAEPEARLV